LIERLPRKNPEIEDPIEQIDAKYLESGGDYTKAWALLTDDETEFIVEQIHACLTNPRYYLENYHFIRTKKAVVQPLWPFYDSQEMLMDSFMRQFNAQQAIRIIALKARQMGLCLDPSTRVLTADLRWVRIADMKVGQELVAVDEYPMLGPRKGRHMRTGIVQGVVRVHHKAYRITFDDGRSVVCTGQHPWLSKKAGSQTHWRSIDGNKISKKKLRVGTKIRSVTTPWSDPTVEDGWFGGILDGEGSLANKKRAGASVNVTQSYGTVYDRAVEYCRSRGYHYRLESDRPVRKSKFGKGPVPKIVVGRMDEIFRLIGQTRPSRFIGRHFWEDRELPGKHIGGGWSKIVSIDPLGDRSMIDLQTSTGTYIAEGFVSHNTTIGIALMCWLTFLHPHVHAMSMSDEENKVDVNFGMARIAYANLPWWMAPEKRYDIRGQLLGFDKKENKALDRGLQSLLYFESANQPSGAAYSKSLFGAHLAEVARYRNSNSITEGIFGSLVNFRHSIGIMESTARGRGNPWHHLCRASEQKKLGWDFVFLEWIREPGYSISAPPDFKRTTEEVAVAKKANNQLNYEMTDGQFAWRREKMLEFEAVDGDPEKFFQEFPMTAAEAFIASGRCAFSKRRLYRMSTEFAHPPRWKGEIRLDEKDDLTPRFSKQEEGRFWMWEEPIKGMTYYIAADPSMGIDGGDYACAQVYAIPEDINSPLRQVARWHGYCPPTLFARVIAAMGYYFNTAEICPECNTITTVASDLVKVLMYPKWYRWMREDKAKNAYSSWIGWQTTFRNKSELIGRFREALDEWTVVVRCEEDIDEMLDFVEEEEGCGRYKGREHDDAVMAHMICYYCSTQLRPRKLGIPDDKQVPKDQDFQNTEYSPLFDRDQPVEGDYPDYLML